MPPHPPVAPLANPLKSDCFPSIGTCTSLPFLPLGEELGSRGDVGWGGAQGTQCLCANGGLSVLACAAWISALVVEVAVRFSRLFHPSPF